MMSYSVPGQDPRVRQADIQMAMVHGVQKWSDERGSRRRNQDRMCGKGVLSPLSERSAQRHQELEFGKFVG